MFSCCVIGYKHLLIQLWINRVTAEGLYWVLWTDFAVSFQLETHQSLAPLFSLGLHRGPAICHMAHTCRVTHHAHTVYSIWTEEHTNKNERSGNTFTQQKCANTHTSVHIFFPPSELIHSCYSNIKVIKHAVRREREREIERGKEPEKVMAWVWLQCSCIFFSI